MEAEEKTTNVFLQAVHETALKSSLVSAIYGKIPKSPEEILKSNRIDIIK